MSRYLSIVAAATALAIGGCGGGDDDGSGDSASTTAPAESATATDTGAAGGTAASATGTTIKTSDSEFGTVLFDGDDGAIYLFDKEKSTTSECYGDCATAWPPVLTKGPPVAGTGAEGSLLGTTPRNDGSTQVTYDGHPLYYYESDSPGKILCNNVDEFGGLWLVVKPSGEAAS